MPDPRKRIVVEEVDALPSVSQDDIKLPSEVVEESKPTTIKEKVEELQEITEHIAEDVKESSEVQKEIQEAVSQNDDFVAPKQAPDFNPLVVIIPGVLLLGALVGGVVFYQKSMSSIDDEIVVTDITPAPSVAPSASPSATTKTSLTKYQIAIKNGSGIAGEAGRAQTLVEGAGFKVSGTGNADSYTYTKTVIKTKASVEKDFLDELTKALGKNYTLDKNITLSASSVDDVQIIVGSLKSAQ